MPSDYKAILEDNLYRYGHDEDHLAMLGDMYTEPTHFVFELLQNAEDAGASRCEFQLFDDRLEFRHDSPATFTEDDVRRITGVAKSSKTENLTKIGRFGIGFKSVYAVTSQPEIHSGDEHFQIDRYIRPMAVTNELTGEAWTTLFRLPLNAEGVNPSASFEGIRNCLQNLGSRSLLFLSNITEIVWSVNDLENGCFLRDADPWKGGEKVSIVGESGLESTEEEWLKFRRHVQHELASTVDDKLTVEIAFQLSRKEGGYSIVPCPDTPLVVFFPTERETGLGFRVHGPYRTTLTRDNVPPEDEWNRALVAETAELVADSLMLLRKNGLLQLGVFETMPIDSDRFPTGSMFRPLFDRVRAAFSTEALLPMHLGGFTDADHAALVRSAALRDLLSESELSELTGLECSTWLHGDITRDRCPMLYDYLQEQLAVTEWTPESFSRAVTESFLGSRTDAWMIRLYQFLLELRSLWTKRSGRNGPIRNKPFVRLSDNSHIPPFNELSAPTAYLSSPGELRVPVVKASILENPEAKEFFEALKFRHPDLSDRVLKSILPEYKTRQPIEDLNVERYMQDLRNIVAAIGSDECRDRVCQKANQVPFLIGVEQHTGKRELRRPTELYLRSTELEDYFQHPTEAWYVDSGVLEVLGEAQHHLDLNVLPKVIAFKPSLSFRKRLDLIGNVGHTSDIDLVDYRIDGLRAALDHLKTLETPTEQCALASLIWRLVERLIEQRNLLSFRSGSYTWFYYRERFARFESAFISLLKTSKWLPNASLDMVVPSAVDLAELGGEDFPLNAKLINLLGIRDVSAEEQERIDHETELAESLELDLSDVEFIRNNRAEFEALKDRVVAFAVKPDFPVRPVSNPERRQEKVIPSINSAQPKTYEVKERSVRTSKAASDPRTWLRNQYTNEEGQMVCQICEHQMPFEGKNGKPYFECVELTDRRDIEHRAPHLALCPLCAAKYKEFVKRDPAVSSEVEQRIGSSDSLTCSVTLAGENTAIRFVETHLTDLKSYLEVAPVRCS